jgi:hypothetical protein
MAKFQNPMRDLHLSGCHIDRDDVWHQFLQDASEHADSRMAALSQDITVRELLRLAYLEGSVTGRHRMCREKAT